MIDDTNGLVIYQACPLCSGSNLPYYKTVYTAPLLPQDWCDGKILTATVSNFVRCPDCGLIMQSPRMTDNRISKYYKSGLYRETLGLLSEEMDQDENRRADDLIQYLEEHQVKPTSHIDIGASRGAFLRRTKETYNCDIMGVDLLDDYRRVEYDKGMATPDLVSSIHCLEHTINPAFELSTYAYMTSKWVLLEVPGENCKGGPLRFAHLYYFDGISLDILFTRAGLKVVDRTTTKAGNTRILAVKHG